jgi:hypothetical protein
METVVALCDAVPVATPSDPEISDDLCHLEQALVASGHGIGRFEDGINSDEVSEWLVEQEAQAPISRAVTFDDESAHLDGLVSPQTLPLKRLDDERIEEEFFAAFGDDLRPLRAASDDQGAPYAEARVPTPVIEERDCLTSSCDRALKNVDGMHDAFVRLQEQLAGIERWCDKLIDAKPEQAA